MSGMKISPLNSIYLEEAVRRMIHPTSTLLPWVDKVANKLEWWVEKVKSVLQVHGPSNDEDCKRCSLRNLTKLGKPFRKLPLQH